MISGRVRHQRPAIVQGKVKCTTAVQVPSYRAEPLTPACDIWCEFPVSDRPNAVMQFFQAARKDPTMIRVRGPPQDCSAAHLGPVMAFTKPPLFAMWEPRTGLGHVCRTWSVSQVILLG